MTTHHEARLRATGERWAWRALVLVGLAAHVLCWVACIGWVLVGLAVLLSGQEWRPSPWAILSAVGWLSYRVAVLSWSRR